MHLLHDENNHPSTRAGGSGVETAQCDAHCSSAGNCSAKEEGGCPGHHHQQTQALPDPKTPQQEFAVLDYILKHNQSHGAQLDRLSSQIRENGRTEAAEYVKKAAEELMKSNLYLSLAVSLVDPK